MRVLWLSHFVPFPATGRGALQRSHNLLRYVGARHEVYLIAMNRTRLLSGREAVESAARGLSLMVGGFSILAHVGDRSSWTRAGRAVRALVANTSYLESWLRNAPFQREVSRALLELAPDIIHVDTLGLLAFVEESIWQKVVLNHHNIESHMMRRRAANQGRRSMRWYMEREAAYLQKMEQSVAPRVRMNLTVSELDRDRLRQLAPAACIRVVENGVDTDFFHLPDTTRASVNSLAFAGGMDWYPNRQAVDWLCESIWPALVASEGDWTLTVVGRSPTPRLSALAAADPRVRTTGFVDDVRPTLGEARIYVCPILDGGGTRLKILDALSLERALVSTRLGVEGLGLVEGRHYLNAETPEEFVRQCCHLRANPAFAAELGRAGRSHVVEHFSWQTIGDHLEQAYQEAAQGAGVAPLARINEA